ncbi:TonB-dependent receptor domain-containing protein [Peristeroidobacter soli]|uniref:TonB-dependent receptor domain-containing protein n=1 Tax=Peristeroidobacter soli TaxID=2497877 RepID=UPI00158AB1C4|nr:TonB-dependent receptor [Peristeroidobacter soli]
MAAPARAHRYGLRWIADVVLALTLAEASFGQGSAVHFSIPAQPLASGLLQLGHQADISIAFNHALVADKRSGALEGEMDVQTALARLLEGSGLIFELVRPDLVRIVPARPTSATVEPAPAAVVPAVTEEVTVTARRREESSLRVPISLSVLDGDELTEANLNDIQDIATQAPALQVRTSTSQKDRTVFMRGIGTIATSQSPEPSVATVVDGVVLLRSGQAMLDILDLDQIEVLSGPQGTLFGKNASAGVLNVTTKSPTDTFGGFAHFGYYSGNEYRVAGGLSGPLSERVAGRLSAFSSAYDGNMTNLYNHRKVNGYQHDGARAKLVTTPLDDLTLTFAADITHSSEDVPSGAFVSTGYIVYCPRYLISPPAPNACQRNVVQHNAALAAMLDSLGVRPSASNDQVNTDDDNRTADRNGGASLQVDWRFGADYLLTSISAWRQWRNTLSGYDYDQLSAYNASLPRIVDHGNVRFTQTSQELRVVSPKGGFADFVAGLYFMQAEDRERYSREVTRFDATGVPAQFDHGTNHFGADSENYAVFGEMNFNFTARLRAFLGYRQIWDRVSFDANRVSSATASNRVPAVAPSFQDSGAHRTSGWAGRAGAQFDLTPDLITYVSASRGYKGPAYNVFFNMQSFNTPPLEPETSDVYEIGLKSQLWERRMQFDLAAYFSEFHDYQAQRTQYVAGSYVTNLSNAGSVANRGAELSLSASPTQSLTYRFAGLYNDAFIRKFLCPIELVDCHVNGNELPYAPTWRLNASQNYRRSIGSALDLDVNLAYRWQSRMQFQYTDNSDLTQPDFGILDLSVGLSNSQRRWAAALLVKNILRQEYSSYRANGNLGGVVRWVPRDADRYLGLNLQLDF